MAGSVVDLLTKPDLLIPSVQPCGQVPVPRLVLFDIGVHQDGLVHVSRLANRFELDAMYEQLRDVLVRICFINPDNPDYFMNNLRHFGTRMQLRAKEVQIVRGICR